MVMPMRLARSLSHAKSCLQIRTLTCGCGLIIEAAMSRRTARSARLAASTLLALAVAGCASTPAARRPVATTAMQPAQPMRAPEVMRGAGLDNVIGAPAPALARRLGQPQLDLFEGDARKLQFAGRSCVLDIYLYPLQPGTEPVATHIEARLRQTGGAVDPAQCLSEIGRR
jgi:hypothetical protein